jgi:hypothetical protein
MELKGTLQCTQGPTTACIEAHFNIEHTELDYMVSTEISIFKTS